MNIFDIPLRLSGLERVYLQVILAALSSSEYTSKVDVHISSYSKRQIMIEQIDDFISNCVGLLFAAISSPSMNLGKKTDEQDFILLKKKINETCQEKDFKLFIPVVIDMIEVARRYKIMNPHKMRVEYGKLVHLLMDSKINKYELGSKPILTVKNYIQQYNIEYILKYDKLDEITSVDNRNKEMDYKAFIENYAGDDVEKKEAIERVLLSIGDAQSYIYQSVEPITKLLKILKQNFQNEDAHHSLAIKSGYEGSKLSHDHNNQFKFVYQTLKLWISVMTQLYTLSIASEADLFSKDAQNYTLVDTGQGLNRIQPAHNVGGLMSQILSKIQQTSGRWVGLTVVHLGDRDVPNALVFIDKYRQIPGIINPILTTVEQIPNIYKNNEGIRNYINSNFGDPEKLKNDILRDFFRHAFDGSGSNGGSCIDGRLTSSWNWGSKIAKKHFYPIFLLTGFQSFDGDWSS